MERFWRTLREQCLDLTGSLRSLHDLNVRIFAWVDERYHVTAHRGLLGKTPKPVYGAEPIAREVIDEARLRNALTGHVGVEYVEYVPRHKRQLKQVPSRRPPTGSEVVLP